MSVQDKPPALRHRFICAHTDAALTSGVKHPAEPHSEESIRFPVGCRLSVRARPLDLVGPRAHTGGSIHLRGRRESGSSSPFPRVSGQVGVWISFATPGTVSGIARGGYSSLNGPSLTFGAYCCRRRTRQRSQPIQRLGRAGPRSSSAAAAFAVWRQGEASANRRAGEDSGVLETAGETDAPAAGVRHKEGTTGEPVTTPGTKQLPH